MAINSEPGVSVVEPFTVREWATRYRALSLAVARICYGEKAPRYDAWNLASAEPSDFAAGDNIGIQTGGINADLVCVDLDAPAAIELADAYLPPTGMVEGWSGKARSHRYYHVTNVPPELLADSHTKSGQQFNGPRSLQYNVIQVGKGKGPCVIDVLGTGKQAVAPPSFHKSGERRQWQEFGEPAVVDCRTLYEAVDHLAVACGCASALPGLHHQAAARPSSNAPMKPAAAAEPRYHLGLPALEERVRRAQAYLEKVPGSVSGEGGHHQTWKVACLLLRDFALDRASAWELLDEYNERCDPPWSDAELAHKLEDADRFEGLRGEKLLPPLVERPDDPHRLARGFLDRFGPPGELPRWRFWKEEWWHWNGRQYDPVHDTELRAQLTADVHRHLVAAHREQVREAQTAFAAEAAAWSTTPRGMPPKMPKSPVLTPVTTQMVTNTVQALTSLTAVSGKVPQPAWLLDDGTSAARSYLALTNGLLDVDAFVAGRPALLPHSPRWFSPVCLPYAWEPDAVCARWLRALHLTFGGDAERVALLQEWFGYCLLPTTDEQKFMMLVGDGHNGKSVICAALTAVLGESNVSHVALENFGERFALNATVGKLANVVAEIGELDKTAEGDLKSYTAGDAMTIDRKGRTQVKLKPTARLLFATNNVPRFSDRTDGFWRRPLLVPCDVTIARRDRIAGMDKVEWWHASGELPGMLVWALAGLRRLRQAGFTASAACARLHAEVRSECNPAGTFLREHCAAAARECVSCAELFLAYQEWCKQYGYVHLGRARFGKEVVRAFGEGVTKHARRDGTSRANVYHGIRYHGG